MQKTNNFRVATQPTGTYRKAMAVLFSAALFVSPLEAQDKVRVKDTQPRAPLPGGVFGDTVQHTVRILAIDPAIEAASAYIKSPKNIVVLGVVPGREIEIIAPGDLEMASMDDSTFALVMRRFELTTVAVRKSNDVEQRRYASCTAERASAIRHNAMAQRLLNAARDSTARRTGSQLDYTIIDVPYCEMPTGETSASHLDRRPMPLRAQAERYLVVMTSSKEIKLSELEKRLSTLTTVASDAGLTIEAIAAGLFAGKSDYGGAWVAW